MKKYNKKAIFYSVTVLIFTIILLVIALTASFKKTSHEKKIGEEQTELIKEYLKGENVLFYIDQSAKYSFYNAMRSFAEMGTYFNEPECRKNLEGYIMWENVFQDETKRYTKIECYPSERDITVNFALFLNNQLDKYFEKYPFTIIPKNNYDFNFNETENMIEVLGIATQNVILPLDRETYRENALPTLPKEEQECLSKHGYMVLFKKNSGKSKYNSCGLCPKTGCDIYINEIYCNLDPCALGCVWKESKCEKDNTLYSLKPSFRTKVSYRFISKFNEYSIKSKEIRDNIQGCLIKGSGTPDDNEDLITCSDINKLKTEIKDVEGYKINAGVAGDNYTILFDIEDKSFKNPYPKEKLFIKFGMRFTDTFAPPATEIIGVEEKTKEGQKGKYLVWKKNNASDISIYNIYAKKIEENTFEGVKVKTKKPDDTTKMDKIASIEGKTEWKIEGLEEGNYYFYIIAIDKGGNTANGIGIEPLEASI